MTVILIGGSASEIRNDRTGLRYPYLPFDYGRSRLKVVPTYGCLCNEPSRAPPSTFPVAALR